MTEHAPLPWEAKHRSQVSAGVLTPVPPEDFPIIVICSDERVILAVVRDRNHPWQEEQTAEFVVRACNNFELMRQTLEKVEQAGGTLSLLAERVLKQVGR